MPRIDETKLKTMVALILHKAGSQETEASLVADHLVQADLRGHESHGVGMVPYYIDYIRRGVLRPNTPARLVKDDDAFLVFDGRRGFGHRTATEAVGKAIRRCRTKGLVAMALRNAQHMGRIGAYGEQCIDAGLVSLHFVNVFDHDPVVAPYGGRDARFATNPLCMAMPGTATTDPIVLDMATSKIPIGKARVAMETGVALAADQLLDPEGNPTTDPRYVLQAPRGALLPFGLHKGYGIALFCELLAGVLTGGGTIQPAHERRDGIGNNMLAVLIDPQRLVDAAWMRREIDALIDYVTQSPPQEADQPVLIAGGPEAKALAERRRNGIPVRQAVLDALFAGGEALGIESAVLESTLS